jgi:NADPH:quinone reductase-like Zn-dependent oxidoreductase
VRVRAASINPADWYLMKGLPVGRFQTGLFRPRSNRLGVDFAGTVEAVGRDVTHLRPGDEVYGGRSGALAEYVCVRDAVAPKPANLSFEEAAAVPVAAITALQGLRDKGQIQAGQQVLINGAAGGVGTFAVQVAKSFGAEVTGVCSTRNVELVRSLGADHVVDYTQEDFTRSDRRYDLLLDVSGTRSWSEYKRVLQPDATFVIVGAPKGNRMIGPLSHILKVRLAAFRSSRKVVFFVARLTRADLVFLGELIESGRVKPVVEKRYEFNDVADALRYLGEGHARGKLVITV